MVLTGLVRQAIDELFRQTPRLQCITLRRGTFAGTTGFQYDDGSRHRQRARAKEHELADVISNHTHPHIHHHCRTDCDACRERVRIADLLMEEASQVIAISLQPFPIQTHLTRQSS